MEMGQKEAGDDRERAAALRLRSFQDHCNGRFEPDIKGANLNMATLDTALNTGVTLTERAAEEIRGLLERQGKADAALRVFVSGGGCSGLNYGMAIDDAIEEDDFVYNCYGVKVVVDPMSLNYVKGASIDYVEDAMGGGFKTDHPNATR